MVDGTDFNLCFSKRYFAAFLLIVVITMKALAVTQKSLPLPPCLLYNKC